MTERVEFCEAIDNEIDVDIIGPDSSKQADGGLSEYTQK